MPAWFFVWEIKGKQFGLMSGYITDSLDYVGQVDVVYTDISKAIDRFDHIFILQKSRLSVFETFSTVV